MQINTKIFIIQVFQEKIQQLLFLSKNILFFHFFFYFRKLFEKRGFLS